MASAAMALSDSTSPGAPELGMGIETWKDGWSLLAGSGITRSRYYTENETIEQEGYGPNVMTSVGYCDRDAYCLELGSIVSFNYYKDMFATMPGGNGLEDSVRLDAWFWETALFFSIRARLPHYHQHRQFNPWIKLLSGYGASVGYPGNQIRDPQVRDRVKGMRLQTEGPLFGLSLMNVFNNDRPGKLWFVESTVMTQLNWKSWLVKDGGLLPVVAHSGATDGNPYTLLFNLTVGVRIF